MILNAVSFECLAFDDASLRIIPSCGVRLGFSGATRLLVDRFWRILHRLSEFHVYCRWTHCFLYQVHLTSLSGGAT